MYLGLNLCLEPPDCPLYVDATHSTHQMFNAAIATIDTYPKSYRLRRWGRWRPSKHAAKHADWIILNTSKLVLLLQVFCYLQLRATDDSWRMYSRWFTDL